MAAYPSGTVLQTQTIVIFGSIRPEFELFVLQQEADYDMSNNNNYDNSYNKTPIFDLLSDSADTSVIVASSIKQCMSLLINLDY